MFVWMAKFGAAYGVRTGIHVGVDVLINRLSEPCAASSSCSACCRRLFTGIVGTLGARFVWENGAHYAFFTVRHGHRRLFEGPTTPDLEWPTWIVYSPFRSGSSLMCFPLPAGGLELHPHRRAAAPRPWPCRWPGRRRPVEEES
jgi:C4-dicarboxylate transporter DctQ subunit